MPLLSRRTAMASALGGAAALLAGCDSLGALNALNRLTPGDGGARKVVDGAAFGPAQGAGGAAGVVFFFGGRGLRGDRGGYAFVGQALAARGFVVVIPDYRLVPQVVFPAFVQDGALAIRWVRDNISASGGDAARIALSGHSAGAYISAMLALDCEWLRQAAVEPSIVRALANLAGPYDFYPFDVPASRDAFGGYPDARATQPISFVRADAPPAWLAYGDKDNTVMPRNSIRLAEALQRAGSKAQLKPYPGLDHIAILIALSKPFRGKAPVLADLTVFLRTQLA